MELDEMVRCLVQWGKARDEMLAQWEKLQKAVPHISEKAAEGQYRQIEEGMALLRQKAPPSSPSVSVSRPRKVKRGGGPTLKNKLIQVIGTDELSIPEVLERLSAKGWGLNSNAPNQYASYLLSYYKDVFERTGLGVYKVRSPQQNATPQDQPQQIQAA